MIIQLRYAHQDDFIYILVDAISDIHIDKGADSSRTAYSWPHGMENEYSFRIPSPSIWGELISPDKSLPEFNWPALLLIPVIIFVVFLTRFKTINREKIVS